MPAERNGSSQGLQRSSNPRASLRSSSYIDPSTGAKLNKTFTLRSFAANFDLPNESPPEDSDDRTPLLVQRHSSWTNAEPSRIQRILSRTREHAYQAWQFALGETGKGVLKCALAYLVGSLATFVPVLSILLGRNDSKHMVATITVYFHPARSWGSMLDALICATCAFLYTTIVSLLSMSIAVLFTDKLHMPAVGQGLVCVLFVGGGLGFIGWVKLKKNDPLVNISCSLASLAMITILTKEGAVQVGNYSVDKIFEILRMIVAGVISTMLVSFLVFPTSGRMKLRKNLLDVTDCLADMLALIASSFISGDEDELEDKILSDVHERHKKLSAKLDPNLKESKYEHYFLGTERQSMVEAKLVRCVGRIAQSIGGLRSAAAMQFVVVQEPAFGSNIMSPVLLSPTLMARTPAWMDTIGSSKSSVDERSASGYFGVARASPGGSPGINSRPDKTQPPFRTPAQIFELFIDHLGPSMRSLAYTLKEILDDLPFDGDDKYAVRTNAKFKVSLERALELYRNARRDSLAIVYGQKDMDRTRPIPVQADWEDAAACCGHFSFSLLEVAASVNEYLLILDELQLEVDEAPAGRTWDWMKFWKVSGHRKTLQEIDPEFAQMVQKTDELDLNFGKRPMSKHSSPNIPSWETRSRLKQALFRRLWDGLSFLRRDDIKFAIKVGFGAMLYALPSFIPASRPFYSRWRGEWGLVSYMLVCSMTIGASNTTGYSRILGTCLGAALAIAAWEVSNDNPIALAFFGFCMAYWTGYIILGKGKGPMGRFIMLTYNLSALYAYSLTMQDDDDDGDEEDSSRQPMIFQISSHRVAAVISGCIWGLIITRVVWPISARQRLKDGLSLLWLRMGLIWKRDPLSTLTEGAHPETYMNLREEFYLRRFLATLNGLVDNSKSEFELRRPFPDATYNRILKSTEQMLDAFHAMNEVILKDPTVSPGEESLMKATARERAQLCGRISHMFSVLASSMKLEFSISSDALPNIEHTRDPLLASIFAYRRADAHDPRTSDEDYSLLYTYALVTGQLSQGIQKVLKEVEDLFGTLDEETLRLD